MRVQFIAGIVWAALAGSMLLAPPGAGAAANVTAERTQATPDPAKTAHRDVPDGARKIVKVVFIKNKKHIRRLNTEFKGKKRNLPMCTRAIRIWKGQPSTYSCCAKCKVQAPKAMSLERERSTKAREVVAADVCIPFTDNCWSAWDFWNGIYVTSFKDPIQRAKCLGTIALILVPADEGFRAVRRAGSIPKLAKKLMKADRWGKVKLILGTAAEITGIKDIYSTCTAIGQDRSSRPETVSLGS